MFVSVSSLWIMRQYMIPIPLYFLFSVSNFCWCCWYMMKSMGGSDKNYYGNTRSSRNGVEIKWCWQLHRAHRRWWWRCEMTQAKTLMMMMNDEWWQISDHRAYDNFIPTFGDQFNQPKDYGLIVELPFPPQYWIFLVAFPNSTWLTRLANWREHKLSLLLSIVGLRLTNISTLPSPLKQSWRRYVSKELRNGTCFNPWPSLWRHRLNSSDSCWWLVFSSDAVHHLPRHSDQVVRIPPSHMGSWSVELEIIVIPF